MMNLETTPNTGQVEVRTLWVAPIVDIKSAGDAETGFTTNPDGVASQS